jgi:hypothetical protein
MNLLYDERKTEKSYINVIVLCEVIYFSLLDTGLCSGEPTDTIFGVVNSFVRNRDNSFPETSQISIKLRGLTLKKAMI